MAQPKDAPSPQPLESERAGAEKPTAPEETVATPLAGVEATAESEVTSPISPADRTAAGGQRLTLAVGEMIAGRYRVLRFVAQGGMGEVYEVHDTELGAPVALKTIRPEIAADSRAIERFKREINLSRRISHPNVCRIHDVGRHTVVAGASEPAAEVLFLTMEFLAGETLAARIRSRRLSPAEALPIVWQIAAALDAAHAAGVIHRDLKSSNVILVTQADSSRGPRAVVTDFGLARGFQTEGGLVSISDSGSVAGTPAYMAPEQVQGLLVTPAADIYALGIVVYEMLSGVRPFDGGSALSVAVRRLTESPRPPRELVPDLDPAWEAAILRSLDRLPEARFSSATAFAEALAPPGSASERATAAALSDAETLAAARGAGEAKGSSAAIRRRRIHLGLAVAGALALLLAAALAWRAFGPRSIPAKPAAEGSRAAVSARRTVAILGLKNVTGQKAGDWLATAVGEMLFTDLSSSGSVRVIPGEEVAALRRDLALPESDALSRQTAARLRARTGVDLVVTGSYTVLDARAGGLMRLDLRLQETATGEIVAQASSTGTSAELFAVTSRAEKPLRERLGLPASSPADELRMAASLPSEPAAAQLYSEGLARLRLLDASGARGDLERAVATSPEHPLLRAALADAWMALGYEAKAREQARQALAFARDLRPEQHQAIEARLYALEKQWDKAIERYRSLAAQFPDDLEYGLRLADALTRAGRGREALVAIEGLRRLPSPYAADPRLDLTEAWVHREMGDSQRQRDLAARAARKGIELDARLIVARGRFLEAQALEGLGDPRGAANALEEARSRFESTGDRSGVAQVLGQMANGLEAAGDFQGARRLHGKAATIYRELGDARGVALATHALANIHFEEGDLPQAEALYVECLAAFEAIDARWEVATTFNDLGAVSFRQGRLRGAKDRYMQALQGFERIADKRGLSMALTNLGELMFVQGELDRAFDMHNDSLAVNREAGDKSGEAYDLDRLADVLMARGDLRVARERLEAALAIQTRLGERVAAAETRVSLAQVHLAEGRPAEAEPILREAEEMLRVEGAADAAARAQVALAESLLAQGRAADAEKAFAEARPRASSSHDPRVRNDALLLDVRLHAASRKDSAALGRALALAIGACTRTGHMAEELRLRLALGELEMAAGKSAGARARLAALAGQARARGFRLIAERADSLSSAG
jgi:tetratricopeptide (TPR) repeat protein